MVKRALIFREIRFLQIATSELTQIYDFKYKVFKYCVPSQAVRLWQLPFDIAIYW